MRPPRIYATLSRRTPPGFSLVEMLVVAGLILLIAAMLFPALGNMRKKGESSQCASRLRQLFLAAAAYSADNNSKVIPGRIADGSPTYMWTHLLRPYLGGSNAYDTNVDNKVRCPTYKSGSNYWAWGYGMNARPGYRGPASILTANAIDTYYNWIENYPYRRWFATYEIGDASRRLFMCDATEWQINCTGAGVVSFPDYNRHGTNKCNVLFFDGHVAPLSKSDTDQAVYNPGAL